MDSPPFDANNIEILKAARRQVMQDGNGAVQTEVVTPPQMRPQTLSGGTLADDLPEIQEDLPRKTGEEKNLVEELLHRLKTLAEEEQTIKKEKEQFDRIWAGLEEKRQKLETRLAAINRIKGKLMALNQEVEDIIS